MDEVPVADLIDSKNKMENTVDHNNDTNATFPNINVANEGSPSGKSYGR